MKKVLFTNENYIRSVTVIDTNVESKFLLSAMREAQDVHLQQIIGRSMSDKIANLILNDGINSEQNLAYKNLLDECQLFLAYQSVAILCLMTNVKISNGGIQQTSDENLSTLDVNDTFTIQTHFQNRADFYAKRLQEYILENRASLPEISERKCYQINSQLHSAASTDLWLGGARGKGYGRCGRIRF